ncbi:MAG: sulfotransferase family protein [Actinomycetota bacterium]
MGRASSSLLDRLIFVVGARRSGTNWLQRIVAAHPRVVGVPSETYLFSLGLQPLVERFHHGLVGSTQTGLVYMDRELMLDNLRDFADAVFEGLRGGIDAGADRIVERTPDQVRHLDLLGDIYPDGRILHIVRDGRDVARSLRSQPWGPSSITEAAEEWASAVESAHAVAPRLQHYIELRYEQLLADPRAGIEQVFSWLGLAADAAGVERSLVEAQVRFNVDPQAPAVEEGKWRRDFSDSDLADFERVAGTTLVSLGYEPAAPSSDGSRAVARPTALAADRPGVAEQPGGFRAVLRRLRRSQRGRRGRLERELRTRQRRLQFVVDRFLSAAGAGDWASLDGILTEAAHVRIVDGGRPWQGRGAEARRRLIDVLRDDPAFHGRQILGDVHPGLPSYTVVAAYLLSDGSVLDRVWTLTVQGEHISRVSYYELPTKAGSPAEPVSP